jgi:hypothetical protein
MRTSLTHYLLLLGSVAIIELIGESQAFAQKLRGGEVKLAAVATGEERTSQNDLYVMDLYFKPMRMITIELTDPKTQDKKLDYVWYIVYRGFNRKLDTKGTENAPVNELDPPVAPQLLIPEATLVVTDANRHAVYPDQVIPEALAAINKREKGHFKDSVSIVGPVPEATDPGSPDAVAVEGVFMWRGINPDANRYSVFMTGFSNGIRTINGPDNTPVTQTKTIMQKYWRRGDRFDQRESEIVLDGDVQWIYR